VKDLDFDRLLEQWAASETASAPDLCPTPAGRKAVRALRRAPQGPLFFRRWLPLSAAVAALLILTVIYPALYRPAETPPAGTGRELDIVGLRHAPETGKAAPKAETVSPRRAKKGRARFFERLEFQFRAGQSPAIISFDLRGPREEAISLTPLDDYRLLLEPVEDLYVYVFELSPPGVLIKLFPNATYSPSRNPLRRNLTYYLPTDADWFHLGEHAGEERLYVLASMEPLGEVEDLYAQYAAALRGPSRAASLSGLLDFMAGIAAGHVDQTGGWMFPFHHR
jgi:hypothetical protein